MVLMPPPHLALAKPRSWFQQHGLHTIDIIYSRASWQMMWHGLKVEVFSLEALTLPSVLRHEARMKGPLKASPPTLVISCF
jgi:hypothetical protein